MTSRLVTIRARVSSRGTGPTTVLVHETGEMFVKVFSPKEGLCFVSAKRAGLTDGAKRRAWAASGFRFERRAA